MSNLQPIVPASRRGSIGIRLLFVLLVTALPATQRQAAQSAPASPAPATGKKPSPRHLQPSPAETPPIPEQPAPAPPAPEQPHWPVNDTPGDPSVTWDSHGLHIAATNSSLHQILNQVSAATGAKVEGMGADERVFGEFGPGEARDVLSQLLNGSSYNVLMIGDQGEGTPRQIVLSARHSAKDSGSANRPNPNQDAQDDEAPEQPEVEEQPPQPPLINRPPMIPQGPPGAPRTPQQVLQELQQRQQQMQDQQQQQQQQPH
jgi:hypothetical protein